MAKEAPEQGSKKQEVGTFSVFLFPYARKFNGELPTFVPLDTGCDCWWVHLPRVPEVGEEFDIFMTSPDGRSEREVAFHVVKVVTVIELEEPVSFRVFMQTNDTPDELSGFSFGEVDDD